MTELAVLEYVTGLIALEAQYKFITLQSLLIVCDGADDPKYRPVLRMWNWRWN